MIALFEKVLYVINFILLITYLIIFFKTRKGMPIVHTFGLEDLFYQLGVDLEIWAHERAYERLWPVYDFEVLNGSTEEPYRNPKAPVHIITGSAVSFKSSQTYNCARIF